MTAPYIPSVVPAPLINQQPLLLQPTALVHPQFYQLGSQPSPYPYQHLAEKPDMERKFTLPLRSPGLSQRISFLCQRYNAISLW